MDEERVALRFNSGKPELHYILFYPRFLEALASVQEQGAFKYGYANWSLGGKPDQEYLDAALRHLIAHFSGEVYDEDIGTLHLAQCIWNLMNLLEQNLKELPLFDPDFDQEAFIKRWEDAPKQEGRPR